MPIDKSIESVLVIGSGPIVIGQACEFDYSGTQACRILKSEGIRVVLVNSNPATIMTDPEFADATYIEPITPEMIEKIIAIDNFDLDLPPTDNLLFLRYADKPGVVGIVGQALGKVSVNIAGMHIARDHAGGKALMVITVDSPVDSPVIDSLKKEIGADLAESVTLVV